MKKLLATLLCMFCAYNGLHAQTSLSYSIGYAGYEMDDMNKLLSSIFISPPKILSGVRPTYHFPDYFTQGVDVAYSIKRLDIGLKGTFMTTGGKIAYSDYSGSYYEKITLTAYRIGTMYRYHFAKLNMGKQSLSFFGEVSPAITFTRLRFTALLSLPDYNIHDTETGGVLNTNETGFSIQPLVGSQLTLFNHFIATLSMGYDFEFGAKLKSANKMLRADWTGARVSFGVGYKF